MTSSLIKPLYAKLCPGCNKKFAARHGNKKYCSSACKKKCQKPSRKRVYANTRKCIYNNPNGTVRITSQGYRSIKIDGHWEAEHRVVMEQVLGRLLGPGESVHHKDGHRDNNHPDNLELWLGPVRNGVRASDIECPHCGHRYDGQGSGAV